MPQQKQKQISPLSKKLDSTRTFLVWPAVLKNNLVPQKTKN